jgi:hypothetical protein
MTPGEILAAYPFLKRDTAIAEINKKSDLNIELKSLEREKHRRVTNLVFAIKTQAIPKASRSKS